MYNLATGEKIAEALFNSNPLLEKLCKVVKGKEFDRERDQPKKKRDIDREKAKLKRTKFLFKKILVDSDPYFCPLGLYVSSF